MRRFFIHTTQLFSVPLEGLRSLCADRRFQALVCALFGVLIALCVASFCVLQFWLFPRLNNYKGELTARLQSALGVTLEAGHLRGEWSHLHPWVIVDDVVVFDSVHRPAVRLTQVSASLSWHQLLAGHLGFHALSVVAPELNVRRDKAGALFLGDLPLSGEGDFNVDTVLHQGELSLVTQRLTWSDAMRAAPPLLLQDVGVRLKSRDAKHQLDVHFKPPESLGSPFKGRVDWIGRSFADWQRWQIATTLTIGDVDLAGWRPWVDYPLDLERGRGKLDAKFEATGLDLTHVDGLLAVSNLKLRFSPKLDPLDLKAVQTKVEFQKRDEGRSVQLKLGDLSWTDAQGKSEPAADIFVQHQQQGDSVGADDRYSLRVSRLDLGRWRGLLSSFPLPESLHQTLGKNQFSGVLEGVKADVHAQNSSLVDYSVKAAFQNLTVRSENKEHFVQALSGDIVFDQTRGSLELDSTNALLATPGVLPVNEVPLARLAGTIKWQRTGDALKVDVKSVALANDDLKAVVNGRWTGNLATAASPHERAGTIDMAIVFDGAKSESAWKYVPLSASADTSAWMKGAVQGGKISDFRIEIAGPVWGMPYGEPVAGSPAGSSAATGVKGKFFLGFKVKDATIKYGEGYPLLKNLTANFAMNQNQIRIDGATGQIDAMQFASIKAEMPDVSALENHFIASGQAQGPTESVVRFLKDTPVAGHIHHFADGLSAQGNGKLDIAVDLNLQKPANTKISGQYTFLDNRVSVLPGAPAVSGLNGVLQFSEATLNSTNLQGQWSGAPLLIRVATGDAGTQIEASGKVVMSELRQYYDLPLFDQMSGQAKWQARMAIRGEGVDLALTSDLQGITSSLPEPFNKSASATWPLSLMRSNVPGTGRRADGLNQVWRVSVGNAVGGSLGLNNAGQLVRGRMILGSGQVVPLSDQPGIQFESLRPVNLDYWMKTLGVGLPAAGNKKAGGAAALGTVTLKTPAVTAFGQKFQDFKATVQTSPERTAIQLSSKELQGDMAWSPPGKGDGGERGLLQGKLSRLDLTAAMDAQAASSSGGQSATESLPDLTIRVDDLIWKGKSWGHLNFRARNESLGTGRSWRVDPFLLSGPELKLTGRLNWVNQASGSGKKAVSRNMTALDFKMESQQVGDLLTNLGYPGAVKRGDVQMEGQVSWPASPLDFDPGQLSGNFKLAAKNGQFAKMDPGVGRLLGLLSLQSLPQRLTLDFRDIFSGGLAFESINGRFDIRDGLMKTSDLEMAAPAAQVLMSGQTNLANQTQDVWITVRPALSNSVALGLTVVNPIVGAASFLTQKVLGDPLSRLFSYRYHVTGTWSDPLVDEKTIPTNVVPNAADIAVPSVGSRPSVGPAVVAPVAPQSNSAPADVESNKP